MPAKEISLNELRVTGAAGSVLHKSLTNNKDYDGTARGVPSGVNGEASITTFKVSKSEKPTETWMMFNVGATVTAPEEYRGRQVYPGYIYGLSTLSDEKKVDDTVRGLIRFMRNLGIPESRIEAAKAAKGADFIYLAAKTIEAHSGKNAVRFKFSTRQQKNNPDRVEALAIGPVEADTAAPVVEQTQSNGIPRLDEIWRYGDQDCRVVGVNPSANEETVDLEPLDGSAPYLGLPWFDESGNPQIAFVR